MTKRFPNTLASHVRNKKLSVDMIIQCIFRQIVKYNDLPPKVKNAVGEEMTRRTEKK